MGSAIVFVTIVSLVFLGDMYLKNRVEKYIPGQGEEGHERRLFGGRLLLRKHHNRGLVLNAGEKRQPLIAAVSLVLTLAVTAAFCFSLGRRGSHLLKAGLSLLLGGAFSNTYDRLKRKYVVDYLSLGVKWRPLGKLVFNLADICILIGALLAALGAALQDEPGGRI